MRTEFLNEITPVINASGRMTKLGVSTQSDRVLEMMKYASNRYFIMDELYELAGKEIARMLNTKSSFVINSASGGIVLSVASIICKDNMKLVNHLTKNVVNVNKREVIIPKGHVVNYGAPIDEMIELGGGIVVEAGSSNVVTYSDVESLINENSVALFYVKSHHAVQKNMISISEMVELARKYNLELIVDAAAEEDFIKYYQIGANYVIYSGTKALEGPTSGLVLVDDETKAYHLRLQYYGIGRCMKTSKEAIFGLLEAIDEYVEGSKESKISINDLTKFNDKINLVNGLKASIAQDEAGRKIYRSKIYFDEKVLNISAKEVFKKLIEGKPAIYCRDYEANLGYLAFDPRPLNSKDELDIIYDRIIEIIGG